MKRALIWVVDTLREFWTWFWRLVDAQPECLTCGTPKDFWDKPCHVCIGAMVDEYLASPAGKEWTRQQENNK